MSLFALDGLDYFETKATSYKYSSGLVASIPIRGQPAIAKVYKYHHNNQHGMEEEVGVFKGGGGGSANQRAPKKNSAINNITGHATCGTPVIITVTIDTPAERGVDRPTVVIVVGHAARGTTEKKMIPLSTIVALPQ